jgi:hypothetical protein
MPQFGGKDSKRHFTVVMGNKEHGLYVSSTPSSAAKKAVTKLCSANKSKKVEFSIREITQGSKKKTYGPYSGYIEKLKEPIELKGRVIKYKPVAKLRGKSSAKKGGMNRNSAGPAPVNNSNNNNNDTSRLERVAHIYLITPDSQEENTDEYDEKIKLLEELEKMNGNIFDIRITTNVSYVNGIPIDKTNIWIYSKNISKFQNRKNYEKQLSVLIDVLKYFKKAADKPKLFNTEFLLVESDESSTPKHNEFLNLLANHVKI